MRDRKTGKRLIARHLRSIVPGPLCLTGFATALHLLAHQEEGYPVKRTSYIDYSAVKKGANFSTAAVGFLLRLPAQALPMWPSGSGGNPKKITHDVGPRSLQGEVELTSNRIDLPLCLAASYPPCSFNVACGGLVLLAAHSMSTMTPQRNWAFPAQDMLCNTGERTRHKHTHTHTRTLTHTHTHTF